MCKYNEQINQMANPENRTEMLLLNLSNQINEVRTSLTQYVNSQVGHLSTNVKSSQEFMATQLEDIKTNIKEIKEDRRQDKKDSAETIRQHERRIENISHDKDCPQSLDIEVRILKDNLEKIEKEKVDKLYESLGFFIAIKKFKIIQFALLVLTVVFILVCYNAFNTNNTQKEIQKIENVLKTVK